MAAEVRGVSYAFLLRYGLHFVSEVMLVFDIGSYGIDSCLLFEFSCVHVELVPIEHRSH